MYIYSVYYTYKPFSGITLSIKITASKSVWYFKDLSIHRDRQREAPMLYSILSDGRFGVLVGILAYYAGGRVFVSRTVQTFVCMNMSVFIGSGCFYV
jgi:hypothetical protein